MSDQDKHQHITGEFAERASERPAPQPDEWNISAGARAEIDNARYREEALDAHERKWREEQRKIAASSDPFPDFDLGSRAHRNILAEYEERRTVWEMERDGIERSFAATRTDIRSTNLTLTDEFAARERDAAQNHGADSFSFPAPERDGRLSGPERDGGHDQGRTL
ncbi:MAG: hypothetical protein KDE25_02865 [Novosphingobium sp.]|nr:hypothetical protein [Novosphingobium sp.]